MKTEAEIRAYRDALKTMNAQPCNCAGTKHARECLEGGRMMLVTIQELTWVLGELPERDPLARKWIKNAAAVERRH